MKTPIFQFTLVGPPQRVTEDGRKNLIHYNTALSSAFLGELNQTNFSSMEEVRTLARYYQKKTEPYPNARSLNVDYRKQKSLIEWLNVHLRNANYDDFTKRLVSCMNLHIDEAKIWDAAFVAYVLGKDSNLLTDLLNQIRLSSFLSKLNEMECSEEDFPSLKTYWLTSKVVFPNPPFPIKIEKRAKTPVINPVIPPSPLTQIKQIEAAYTNLLFVFQGYLKLLRKTTITSVGTDEDMDKPQQESRKNIKESKSEPTEVPVKEEVDFINIADLDSKTVKLLQIAGIRGENVQLQEGLNALERLAEKSLPDDSRGNIGSSVMRFGNILLTLDLLSEETDCDETPVYKHCDLLELLQSKIRFPSKVQISGVGRHYFVNSKLKEYIAEELANIIPIAAGESFEKTHRTLKRSEEFTLTETEKNRETEIENRTADRYELSSEIQKETSQSTSNSSGQQSNQNGPVSTTNSSNTTSTTAVSTSQTEAVKRSKEAVQRARNRIQERFQETRSLREIFETEIINLRKIDNSGETTSRNLFYKWVEKVMEQEIRATDSQMVVAINVPEPAAFHLYTKAKMNRLDPAAIKPIPPASYLPPGLSTSLRTFKDINRFNYHIWAAAYDVTDIEAPPAEFVMVTNSYSRSYDGSAQPFVDRNINDLAIPEHYEAKMGTIYFKKSTPAPNANQVSYINGYLGRSSFTYVAYWHSSHNSEIMQLSMNNETTFVPLSFRGYIPEYVMNIEIQCELTEQEYDSWRIRTYTAIMAGYAEKLDQYETQLTRLEIDIQTDLSGDSDAENLLMVREELKKWSTQFLANSYLTNPSGMHKAANGYPEIDFEEAFERGTLSWFWENALSWDLMVWKFLSYHWATKRRWTLLKQIGDKNRHLYDFLNAGSAMVFVPVNPQYTEAVLHAIQTGEILEAEELPALDDETYLAIVSEIAQGQLNATNEGTVIDTFDINLPTNLVAIADGLPNYTSPINPVQNASQIP